MGNYIIVLVIELPKKKNLTCLDQTPLYVFVVVPLHAFIILATTNITIIQWILRFSPFSPQCLFVGTRFLSGHPNWLVEYKFTDLTFHLMMSISHVAW